MLPHLEMGVADVVLGGRSEDSDSDSDSSTWNSVHTSSTSRREEKTSIHSRGSGSYAEP